MRGTLRSRLSPPRRLAAPSATRQADRATAYRSWGAGSPTLPRVVDPLLLAAVFLGAAVLYSSVGHAGASAYLAAMGLLGVSPDVARPTALALNVVVASFVTFRFWQRGHISWRALAPFVVGSIPLAFLGG